MSGITLLLISLWLQLPMLLVVLGFSSVSAGGGEFMVGLFLGLPALLFAATLLGITIRSQWRSRLSVILFWLSILGIFGWAVAFVR
ncbi:hypothetical protein [Nitrosococcus watsonii]|uniref:hypothetical protein n=1 Tax=Nitrosococcus watsonii TaxID=473531 RepID=UPI0012FC5FF3|nr:hypothetical protein [Nitrosococcus watsonii]